MREKFLPSPLSDEGQRADFSDVSLGISSRQKFDPY